MTRPARPGTAPSPDPARKDHRLMVTIALLVGAMLSCECALRIPLGDTVIRLVTGLQRAVAILLSRSISDNRKERLISGYALRTLRLSVSLLILLCAALIPLLVTVVAATGSINTALASLSTPSTMMILSVFCMLYLMMRIRQSSDGTVFKD